MAHRNPRPPSPFPSSSFSNGGGGGGTWREDQRREQRERVVIDVDELDEDPVIPSQKYFLLSYILPEDMAEDEKAMGRDVPEEEQRNRVPMVKVRGSYRSSTEAAKRAEYLRKMDNKVDIIMVDVGKWFGLFPRDLVITNDEVDVNYQHSTLNNMMKEYKGNREEAQVKFQQRKKEMEERARYEGSKAGQEELAARREEPIALATRIRNYTEHIGELEGKIKEVKEWLEEAVKKKASDLYTEADFDFSDELRQIQERIASLSAQEASSEEGKGKGKTQEKSEGKTDE